MGSNSTSRFLYFASVLSLLLVVASGQVAAQRSGVVYRNPVMAGDYPDPSVIRVGNDYWATATSSEWAPEFPLLHSRDLVNWEIVGAVFEKRPEWSNGNYWAPEISEYRGRFYVYYVGHKNENGPLCVGVATASRPAGPYSDRGPLVCQDAGSIDAMAVTDEHGDRYMIWKEDGNSRKQSTPIWAQKLTRDGTKLVGERRELIRNDAAWEGQLVEGPFILRQNGWFYLFFSGNACCGRECNYALGVARSRTLLGPWEKNPSNPILRGNDRWKCPGHGSIVADNRGRDFLLYHAYDARDSVYVGRQALLDEVTWGSDGWPSINGGRGPGERTNSSAGAVEHRAKYAFADNFSSPAIGPGWQWPQSNRPLISVVRGSGGTLSLSPRPDMATDLLGGIVARSTSVGDYRATVEVLTAAMKRDALAGLAAYGDAENAVGAAVGNGKINLWRREKNQTQTLATVTAPNSPRLFLRMSAKDGHRFHFEFSSNERDWKAVGPEVDGAFLPPWDRGVRVALTSGGSPGATGRFRNFRLQPVR